MRQALRGIEWSGIIGEPIYFRFLDASVVNTESHAGGMVNIDVDAFGNIVGVKLLSDDAEAFTVLLRLAGERGLDLKGLHLSPRLR